MRSTFLNKADKWITKIFAGGTLVAGGKLKEEGTIHWQSPNTGASDDYGFKALPGGYRTIDGNLIDIGLNTHFWSSSETSPSGSINVLQHLLYHDGEYIGFGYALKNHGYSVRCLKD